MPRRRLLAAGLRRLCAEEPLRFRVSGDCMEPVIPPGSTVEVVPGGLPFPGDIVAFAGSRSFVAHRVIGYRPRMFQLDLVTQGDRAAHPDAPVPPSRVLGRVKACVTLRDRVVASVRFVRFALSRIGAR